MRGQPGDRTDGTRNKEETVRIALLLLTERFGQPGTQHKARQIIIAQRRVAAVTRDQYFLVSLTG